MKQLGQVILCGVVLVFLVGVVQPVRAAEKALAVPLRYQEQTLWCWAGCSGAVLNYFTKTISQCYIADFGKSRKDCCATPINCNSSISMYTEAQSILGILKHWCVGSTGVDTVLTFRQCKQEINAGRPFIIRYLMNTGNGHFIVGRGYKTDTPGWLFVMNPWPGEGYGTFKYSAVKRTPGDHTWTHTLRNVKRDRAAADWRVANTAPIKSGTYWNYNLSLAETADGCGRLTRMYHDFYDENNVFLNRQENTPEQFVAWFDDCADKDFQLPRKTEFCGNTWTTLGGRESGYIDHHFVIKCDAGTTITRSKKIALPKAGGVAQMIPEALATPASGPLEATGSPEVP